MNVAAATQPPHPLLARMRAMLDAPALDASDFDAWAARPGHALAVFTEDPVLYRETLDLAVIVPELARAFAGRFRVGLLLQAPARALAPRYGLRRWPALVMLKDGRYVGAIDGLRDWREYLDEIARLLAAEPTRPPAVGIAVRAAAPNGGPDGNEGAGLAPARSPGSRESAR
ncbi:MAG: hydrogenase [Pseudomonadota bacterium]